MLAAKDAGQFLFAGGPFLGEPALQKSFCNGWEDDAQKAVFQGVTS